MVTNFALFVQGFFFFLIVFYFIFFFELFFFFFFFLIVEEYDRLKVYFTVIGTALMVFFCRFTRFYKQNMYNHLYLLK